MVFNFKNCLFASFIAHISIYLFALMLTSSNGIKKPFVVFGAYSKKNYHTLYKNGQIKRSGHGSNGSTRMARNRSLRHNKIHNKSLRTSKKYAQNSKLKLKKSISKSKVIKKNNIKSSGSHKTTKHIIDKSRPIITEASGKKNKLIKTKLKNKNTLSNKDELKTTKKEISKEENKVDTKKEDLNKKQEDPLKKTDFSQKIEPQNTKELEDETKNIDQTHESQIETKNDELAADEENIEDDDLNFDLNETTSTLVLSFGGKIDPEMTLYQKCVQQEVERLWKPPLGVPKGTTCRISFLVDRKGKIQNFEIKKRSSVLIYDLSILRVAHLFKFDKKLWGKNFIIDFCQ